VIDGALIRSRASVRAIHAQALPIGQLNVIAGCSTQVARGDWLRALHVAGKDNSNASVVWMVVFDSYFILRAILRSCTVLNCARQ
jgi:hypothetical protein